MARFGKMQFAWFSDFFDWGKRVQRDIKALEAAVNRIERECCKQPPTQWERAPQGGGDPGPPPPPPPEDE